MASSIILPLQMIVEAIVALKERNGSSQYAIAKYIEQNYTSDLPANFKRILSIQLRNLSNEGRLTRIKSSFKLSDELKKATAKTLKDQQKGSDQMHKLPAASKESTKTPVLTRVRKRTPSKVVIPIAPTGYTPRRKGSSADTATAKTGTAASKNPSPPPSSKHKKSSAAAAAASNKKRASAGAKERKKSVKDIVESPRAAKSGGSAKSKSERKTPAKAPPAKKARRR
ncbi:hypothetical protein O6H91_04G025500 [Diphasiastrum complanatum]|uniref:Uncharacterized protein n=1 Tax=Diphasiastrum complanatum TaxID=34168 RepID=A0ACC2DVA6_DIPCM|nr:hypothetical protein O6H91_04G025500 [Diphasiastrum complanatum]